MTETATETATDPYNWTRVWVCACGIRHLNLGWIKCAKCAMVSPMRDAMDAR